jgi:PAS domain S-box-containing protein
MKAGENDSNPGGRRQVPVANAEQHLQQLVDTALDAVITCDDKSRITVWNNGAERLFGWTAEEAIGLLLTETIIPLDFHKAHNRGMENYLKTGDGPVLGQRIEIEAVDRSGRRFPVELSINPIKTEGGLGFSGFIREISDRLKAEQTIREGEERLQLIIDAADEGVWDYQFDEKGVVVESFYGEKTRELLGEDAAKIPPDRLSPFDEERDAVRRAWELHWNQVEDTFLFEYRIINADDGETHWVRERGIIVRRDESGRPRRAVGSVVDITARRKLENTLLVAQKGEALGLVAGGFAHDINNVLSIIRGHASILKHDKGLPASAVESLDVIDLAVGRARTLTHNMLQLGRPVQAQRRNTPINKLLQETLDLARPALPRSIHVRQRLDLGSDEQVFLNPEQLQQVILNLLLNARDAMGQGGNLDMKSFSRPTTDGRRIAVIQIIDTGCGIPPGNISTIFDPFYTTKGANGTGLGLATVKKFVEDSGGSILINSEVDQGTTMEIELPLHESQDDSGFDAELGAEDFVLAVTPANILLAEDHSLLRPMLKGAIAMVGHHVAALEDAKQVRELGLKTMPDLMVMDIDLPGGSGNELVAEIRAHWKRAIPVVYITGNSSFEIEQSDTSLLLRKPFDLEDLTGAISRLLNSVESD